MERRPTLADIAALAGTSKTAASLILNDRPGSRLSADTVERVRAAARQLNYRPNPAARSLRIGKTATVGFISDDVTVTRYASAMIRGLLDVADDREHTVLIAEAGHDPERMAAAIDAMIDRNADGLIFGAMSARRIDLPPLPSGLPVVLLNSTSVDDLPSVLPAEYEAGYAITRLLIESRPRARIALIGASPWAESDPAVSVTLAQRFQGIRTAVADAGTAVIAEKTIRFWEPDAGYRATTELLAEGVEFDALICMNDRLAFGSYQALQEAGVRIPQQVSIVSFDDDEIAGYLRPGLTTVRIPYEEMGRRAMELVLGSAPRTAELITMPLRIRDSASEAGTRSTTS
jgi:LacI family transcriptional regulator